MKSGGCSRKLNHAKCERSCCLLLLFLILNYLAQTAKEETSLKTQFQSSAFPLSEIGAVCTKKEIYIYNVPGKFSTELLSEDRFELVPGTKYSQWQSEYFLHQSLLNHPCTTRDPEEASIFYVPLYGSGMRDAGIKDRTNIKDTLFDWLREQKSPSGLSYFERNGGKDHAISLGASRSWCKPNNPKQRTSKCLGFSQYELFHSNLIKLSVEFTGLLAEHLLHREYREKLSRIIIVPYVHFDAKAAFGLTFFERYEEPKLNLGRRKYLLTFSGSILKKTAPFRGIFKSVCDSLEGCLFQDTGRSRQVQKTVDFENLYSESTFCAVLGGDTRASKRLFDAISSFCIPVVFDPLLVLPFASSIPYDEFIVHAPFIRKESDVSNTFIQLQKFSEDKILSSQLSLAKYKKLLSYFSSEGLNAVDMIVSRLGVIGRSLHTNNSATLEQVGYSDWISTYKKLCADTTNERCRKKHHFTQVIAR